MPPTFRRLADRGHHGGRLQPVERSLETIVVPHASAPTDKGQDFVRGCRHQTGCLQTGVAGLNDLRGSPDQNIRVPDRRHAVLWHGFDANGDSPGAEIDRCDALGLCQREEWISHQILRVARRQIARQRAKEIELFTLRFMLMPRHDALPDNQRRS